MATERGFTIVEIIVTVTVLSIFEAIFTQAYVFMSSQAQAQARRVAATTVANANLAKYRSSSSWGRFDCHNHTHQSNGYKLLTNNSPNREPVPEGNFGQFRQQVIIYSPRQCVRGSRLIVESSVTYGHPSDVRTVMQVANYVY